MKDVGAKSTAGKTREKDDIPEPNQKSAEMIQWGKKRSWFTLKESLWLKMGEHGTWSPPGWEKREVPQRVQTHGVVSQKNARERPSENEACNFGGGESAHYVQKKQEKPKPKKNYVTKRRGQKSGGVKKDHDKNDFSENDREQRKQNHEKRASPKKKTWRKSSEKNLLGTIFAKKEKKTVCPTTKVAPGLGSTGEWFGAL